MYLLPWLVHTWKQCSFPRMEEWRGGGRRGHTNDIPYLPSHFLCSSDVRHEMYLLPWLVDTWKQCSFPRMEEWRGRTSISWEVKSMECMVTELVRRLSWDRDDRIRELIRFLKGYTKTSNITSIRSFQVFSPGTLKKRWNIAMVTHSKLFVSVFENYSERSSIEKKYIKTLNKCNKVLINPFIVLINPFHVCFYVSFTALTFHM